VTSGQIEKRMSPPSTTRPRPGSRSRGDADEATWPSPSGARGNERMYRANVADRHRPLRSRHQEAQDEQLGLRAASLDPARSSIPSGTAPSTYGDGAARNCNGIGWRHSVLAAPPRPIGSACPVLQGSRTCSSRLVSPAAEFATMA
jgi:hypothetical protein